MFFRKRITADDLLSNPSLLNDDNIDTGVKEAFQSLYKVPLYCKEFEDFQSLIEAHKKASEGHAKIIDVTSELYENLESYYSAFLNRQISLEDAEIFLDSIKAIIPSLKREYEKFYSDNYEVRLLRDNRNDHNRYMGKSYKLNELREVVASSIKYAFKYKNKECWEYLHRNTAGDIKKWIAWKE